MKKKFTLLTISIVLLICATFVIYKSDTKVEYTKPKEFINSGNTLAWTVGGVKQTDAFPTKNDGYVFDSLTCQDGVTADWDVANWGLININSNGQNKIKCTVNFIKDEYRGKKCKRATELHTEVCEQTDANYYCSGAGYTAEGSKGTTTITYGNLGTTGTLASGDAFDCDIDGDDIVDDNERFYYVSTATNGITTDTNTAVLIYYNDYVTSPVAYALQADTGLSADSNEKGPVTAIKNLPTINDWSTTLTSTTRDITNENNTVRVSNFQYKKDGTDLAARLLTYQEVKSACNITVTIGELDNCNYLLENTKYASSSNPTYGAWLETAHSSLSRYAWVVLGTRRFVYYDIVKYAYYGARPAIEVAKTDIEY